MGRNCIEVLIRGYSEINKNVIVLIFDFLSEKAEKIFKIVKKWGARKGLIYKGLREKCKKLTF
jgi:hypothetical protein